MLVSFTMIAQNVVYLELIISQSFHLQVPSDVNDSETSMDISNVSIFINLVHSL